MALCVKKTVVLGLLLGCGTAMAGGMTAEPVQPVSNYDGFYIGADVGGGALLASNSWTETVPGVVTQTNSGRRGYAGIVGGGLLGYDFTLYDHFKLGLEGFITADQLPITSYVSSSSVAYSYTSNNKLRYNWGVRAIPGYEFSEGTVAHIILGYSKGYFSYSNTSTYASLSGNYNRNGFQFGMGITTPLFSHVSFGVDAIGTWYGSNTITGTGTSSSTNTWTNKLGTLEGLASLRYKFV
jgi:hypothetical protein